MKIIITESQYSTLFRRYASNLPIEEIVDYFLDFFPIEKYKTFESFYKKIKDNVTFRIKHDMLHKGTVSTTDYVNNQTQEVSKVEEQVKEYIDNNLKDKIEGYYIKHSKKKNKNLQEQISRILREETKLPSFIKRRFSEEDIYELISDIKFAIPTYGGDEYIDDVIYDEVREFMMNKSEFSNGTLYDNLSNDEWLNQLYKFEEPLRDYVRSVILNIY